MKFYLATQLKNEKYRIQEWVDYHLKLGFDKILIFLDYPEDGSDELVAKICSENKNVLLFFTNLGVQINTPYGVITTSTIQNYSHPNQISGNLGYSYGQAHSAERGLQFIKDNFSPTENDWFAFFDVDEFIAQTGKYTFKEFFKKLDKTIDRLYFPSYDMKCPIDLQKSVIEQSLYRWSDEVRNKSDYLFRGKSMSKIYNLFNISCIHALDSDKNKNPSKHSKVMSTGGNVLLMSQGVKNPIIDILNDEEYFKLFHYRNDSILQEYDVYDDSVLKIKNYESSII